MKGIGQTMDPYRISSLTELEILRDKVNSGDTENQRVYVKLVEDIALTGRNWVPIGTEKYPFRGVFDGEGHSISQMKIQLGQKDYIGLFGVVEHSEIKNIGLVDCSIQGREYVGGIVGRMSANSEVEKCVVKGSIVAKGNYVGGLVGYSDYYNSIKHSYVEAIVETEGKGVGGIVGYNGYKSNVAYCYTKGEIVTQKDSIGGIVGYNGADTYVISCFSIMTVKGDAYVGGIVGKSEKAQEQIAITNCIALNEKIEGSSVGRITGEESGIGNGFNYAFGEIKVNNQQVEDGTLENKDGENLTREQVNQEITYLTKDFSYSNGWILRSEKLPLLVGIKSQNSDMPQYLKKFAVIPTVYIEIEQPVRDKYIEPLCKCNDPSYTVRKAYWQPSHEVYQVNTPYTFFVIIDATDGYAFNKTQVFIEYNGIVRLHKAVNQEHSTLEVAIQFDPISLPNQKGKPVIISGNPPCIGAAIVVGEGTLAITADLEYKWYRSTSESVDDIQKNKILSDKSIYAPKVEDFDYYLIVEVGTEKALGVRYLVTEKVKKQIYNKEVAVPQLDQVTTDSITIKPREGYEYAIESNKDVIPTEFTQQTIFDHLDSHTAYYVFQRIAETDKYEKSIETKLRITTEHIIIDRLESPPTTDEIDFVVGEPIRLPEAREVRTNVADVTVWTTWHVCTIDNEHIAVDGKKIVEEDRIYVYKAVLTLPSWQYCFDKQLENNTGVKVDSTGNKIIYTFICSPTTKAKRESTKQETKVKPVIEKVVDKVTQEIELQEAMRTINNKQPNHMGVWNLQIRS